MIIIAPAKVNLYLKVLDTRPDGYHNITTVFERIDLADKIHIKRARKGIRLSSNIPITQKRCENLAYKAAKAILDFAGSDQGLEIYIDKKIPIAAGLGGGSSDAASVLTGVNKLLALKVGREDLEPIAKGLGADVPFFLLESRFAIGTARGDSLKGINSGKVFYHIIICPYFHLLTKNVYDKLDSIQQSKDLTNSGRGVKIDAASLGYILHNDLEPAAVSIRKDIGRIIERLAWASGRKAVMSGSGPSVFSLFQTRKEAEDAKKKLVKSLSTCDREGWQIFIARTL